MVAVASPPAPPPPLTSLLPSDLLGGSVSGGKNDLVFLLATGSTSLSGLSKLYCANVLRDNWR